MAVAVTRRRHRKHRAGGSHEGSNLCLDDRSASTANGNPVQIYTCNGTGAQQVTVVQAGSTLHILGKCVDIVSGGTADGTTRRSVRLQQHRRAGVGTAVER